MDFISLRAINFLTLGDSGVLHLSGRGLNLLQGENIDDTSASSNGAGKSSIPDALCWALFGTTARGESGDAVVNELAKKDCQVMVVLRDGAVDYTITRHRKHKTHKNTTIVTTGTTDLTKGTEKETQAEIERILGCSYEVFKASIYAGQEEMPDLPKMTDKQLKMLIEQAAGVERLERAYAIAGARLNAARSESSRLAADALRLKDELHATEVAIETTKLKHASFETQRATDIAARKEQASQLAARAGAAVFAIKNMGEDALLAERDEIQKQAEAYDVKRAHLKEAEDALGDAKHRAAMGVAELVRLTKEARAARTRFDNAADQLKHPCKACGKPHTEDELDKLKEHLKDGLKAAVALAEKASIELPGLDQAQTEANAEVQKRQALVPDPTALLGRSSEVNAELNRIHAAKIAARDDVNAAKAAREKADQLLSAPNPYQAMLESQQAGLEKGTKRQQELKGELEQAMAQVGVATAVAKVYSPAGVRAHILDTVTPFLNDRTADYLGVLGDGNISAVWTTLSRTAKGELRESFKIEVEHAKGGKTFGLLSGGEKRKVRLACMLALQDLVASRATKPLNLMVLDEIDDALDEAGLERLMTILEKKAREKGTLIMISHNSLADWCDQISIVRKSGGISSLEGALCVA
jgi:DNA repair exonuclease SbcCD ATPase subunit